MAEDNADQLELTLAALEDACVLNPVQVVRDGVEVLDYLLRRNAWAQRDGANPVLLLMDVNMPRMNGIEALREIKLHDELKTIPVVMLTAKADEVDRIVGLELGADDYVTKPFSPREIVLRVQSVLRRMDTVPAHADELEVGGIKVDRIRHQVQVDGKESEFTATEFKLLSVLMERCGRLQSREVLLNDVWGYESVIDTRTVDTHIRRLREKLGTSSDLIETVRGFGYRMVAGGR